MLQIIAYPEAFGEGHQLTGLVGIAYTCGNDCISKGCPTQCCQRRDSAQTTSKWPVFVHQQSFPNKSWNDVQGPLIGMGAHNIVQQPSAAPVKHMASDREQGYAPLEHGVRVGKLCRVRHVAAAAPLP